MLAELTRRLPEGARVLDLGCGAGTTAQGLSDRFAVVGVDISPAQVDLARAAAPGATFVVGDLATVDFPPRSFDAVAALYSISHVPREEHPGLFRSIARWLAPGGLLLASLGATDAPDWTGDWLGVPMFFSAWDADTNRRLLREAGFALEYDEVRTMAEPEGDVSFLWVLARLAR
jgi:SAM-dependent methyltransferase